jgi:hypothetical protein
MSGYEQRMPQYGPPLATEVSASHEEPRDCWRGHEAEVYGFAWPTQYEMATAA